MYKVHYDYHVSFAQKLKMGDKVYLVLLLYISFALERSASELYNRSVPVKQWLYIFS